MGVRDFGLTVAKIVPYIAGLVTYQYCTRKQYPVRALLQCSQLLRTRVVGIVGVSGYYQGRVRRYARPIKPVFDDLSCYSLAVPAEHVAKPDNSTGCEAV